MSNFKAGQVKKSLRRFEDYSDDLLSANMDTFDDRLNIFVAFCTEDQVFSKIHAQLLSNPNVNEDEWYKDKVSKMSSMVGSAPLELPTNSDDRLSLMYKILIAIHSGKIRFLDFAIQFFAIGSSGINEHIYAFQDAILNPLIRELNYKIEEIEDNLPEDNQQPVQSSIFQIIHTEGNFIQQVAQGDNNVQTVEYENNSQKIRELINELKEEVQNANLDERQKSESFDMINGVEKEISSQTPNKTVIGTLLGALPPAANIASIVSAILALI
jgi:Arc/MetJ-type ribon-helix-helix transcriptional regulator